MPTFCNYVESSGIGVVCSICGDRQSSGIDRECGGVSEVKIGEQQSGLTEAEIAELLPDENDPTLIGNRIEAAIKRFGIPPCGGCGSRRDWLNRAHAYLRELANQTC